MQIKDLIPWARKDHAPDAKTDETNPIATLQRDMNRVFESFWNRVGDLDWPWGGGEAKSDVVETDDAVEVSIELPGMEMKDIEVSVTDDMLTVKGEKRIERPPALVGFTGRLHHDDMERSLKHRVRKLCRALPVAGCSGELILTIPLHEGGPLAVGASS